MTDIARLWQRLKPHAVRDLGTGTNGNTGTVTTGTLSAHSLSGTYHTGTLSVSQAPWVDTHIASAINAHKLESDPHTQYVLAAGDTMTGTLAINAATQLQFQVSGTNRASFIASATSLDISPLPTSPAASDIRFFTNTNTTGTKRLVLNTGDGTGTVAHQIATNGTTIFNAQSANMDFNIRGDTDVSMFYGDASADSIGIGTNLPAYKLDVNGTVRASASLTTQLITTTPANTDLLINPAGTGAVQFPNDQTLRTSSFDSSFPINGWQINEVPGISGYSALTIGKIQADELAVRVFVADEVRVDRGDEFWTKSYGIVYTTFTSPSSVGGTVSVTFEDSPALTGAIFSNNDYVLFRNLEIDTGINLYNIWGQVSGYVDNGNGTQTWTFTLRSGATSKEVIKGSLAIDFGASGAALIHLSVIDAAGSPYIKMRKWVTNPYEPANYTTYIQLGHLGSTANAYVTPAGFGLYVRATSDASRFLLADDNGLQIRGAAFKMYNSTLQTVDISSTNGSVKLGTDISSPSTTSFDFNGATGDLAIRGSLEAAAGDVLIDDDGARIRAAATTYNDLNAYRFETSGGYVIGGTYAYDTTTTYRIGLLAYGNGTTKSGSIFISANEDEPVTSNKEASILLEATSSLGTMTLSADDYILVADEMRYSATPRPTTNGGADIGTSSFRFGTFHVNTVTANTAVTVGGTAVSLVGHTHSYLSSSGGSLGGTLTAQNITFAADNTYDVGSSGARIQDLYAVNLHVDTIVGTPSYSHSHAASDINSGTLDEARVPHTFTTSFIIDADSAGTSNYIRWLTQTSTGKAWDLTGRAHDYATGAQQNDLLLTYYDGSTINMVFQADSATRVIDFTQTPTVSGTAVSLSGHNHDAAYVPLARTVTAGAGLTGGGALSGNITISHTDTSSQASVDNSGVNFIQDITLDTYGHITAIGSASISSALDAIYVNVTGDTMTGALTIDGSADAKQLIVQGHSTQTDNLVEWQNSSSTLLGGISGSGAVGIGLSPVATSKLYVYGQFGDSATIANLVSDASVTTTGNSANSLIAFGFTSQKNGSHNYGSIYGVNGNVYNNGSGTLSAMIASVTNVGLVGSSAGTVTNAYHYLAAAPTRAGGSTATIGSAFGMLISNQGASFVTGGAFGVFISDQSGAAFNYSLYTNAGLVRFGDVVTADSDVYVNGDLLMSNGSASLPSIASSADTNTGILWPSADTLGFATGGVQRVTLSTSLDTTVRINAAPDTDNNFFFGRAALGQPVTNDSISFAHYDNLTSTNYAWTQYSTGETRVNAANAQTVSLSIAGTPQWIVNSDRLLPRGDSLVDIGDYNRKVRVLNVAELKAQTLVAEKILSTIGGNIIVAPTTKLIAAISAATGAPGVSSLYTNTVAYWSFNETSGTREDSRGANDLSGSAVSSDTGKQGNAAVFTGSNSSGASDNAALSTGNVTWYFATWIYPTNDNNTLQCIAAKGTPSGDRSWALRIAWQTDNRVYLDVWNTGQTQTAFVGASTFGALSINTWYFVECWHDATADQIGVAVNRTENTTAFTHGTADDNQAFTIGQFDNAQAYIGRVDEAIFVKGIKPGTTDRNWLYNSGNARTFTDLYQYGASDINFDVEHNNLRSGEYVIMKTAPGGVAQVERFKMTSSASTITGGYRYTATRDLDMTGSNDWQVGDAVASEQKNAGEGFLWLTSTATEFSHTGPGMIGYVRTSTDATGIVPAFAVGNLRSFLDYGADEFGNAAGNNLTLTPTSGFRGYSLDRTNGLRLFNADISIYESGNPVVTVLRDSGLNLASFSNAASWTGWSRSVTFTTNPAAPAENNVLGQLRGVRYTATSPTNNTLDMQVRGGGTAQGVDDAYMNLTAIDTDTASGLASIVLRASATAGYNVTITAQNGDGSAATIILAAPASTHHVRPIANSTYDVGTGSLYYANGYITHLRADQITPPNGVLEMNDDIDLNSNALLGVGTITGTPVFGANVSMGSHNITSVGTISGASGTFAPAAGTTALTLTTPANQTVAMLDITSANTGNTYGPWISIGRNTNASTRAGWLRLTRKDGVGGDLWVDASGNLRIGADSTSATDLGGTVVGTQTSWIGTKEDIAEWDDIGAALEAILDTKLFQYHLRGDTSRRQYRGLVISESDRGAWFSENDADNQTPVLNERNLFGYLIAAIQAQQAQIRALRAKYEQV